MLTDHTHSTPANSLGSYYFFGGTLALIGYWGTFNMQNCTGRCEVGKYFFARQHSRVTSIGDRWKIHELAA